MKNNDVDFMTSTGSPAGCSPAFTAIDANVYHGSSRDKAKTASKSTALRKSTRRRGSTTDSTLGCPVGVILSSDQISAQLQKSSQIECSLLKGKQANFWSVYKVQRWRSSTKKLSDSYCAAVYLTLEAKG